MNVIVTNKQKSIIDNANIDAIKDFNGVFNVDDLISKVKNYFFNKMIIDATSIVNFMNDEVIEKLTKELGAERLYILLPNVPETPESFISKLIELHIYNFSTNINDIMEFLKVPNTYEKIIGNQSIENNSLYVDNSVKEDISNSSYVENQSDINQNIENILDTEEVDINESQDNNAFFDSNLLNNVNMNNKNNLFRNTKRIIGFKNVTINAGSTTLCYMLSNLLKKTYNIQVDTLEINKNDFKYYQDSSMISLDEGNVNNAILNSHASVIIVDLNNCKNLSFCTDVIYLVEPSVIKLNRLMINNRYSFRELYGKKIVLNKSFLSNQEVEMLSKEAGVNFFYNIPSLNDRQNNEGLLGFLNKLGIN